MKRKLETISVPSIIPLPENANTILLCALCLEGIGNSSPWHIWIVVQELQGLTVRGPRDIEYEDPASILSDPTQLYQSCTNSNPRAPEDPLVSFIASGFVTLRKT